MQPPFCTHTFEGFTYGDCGWQGAPLYFVAVNWVCESLLLNLLIGITLHNFTSLTDDMTHIETPDWRHGASDQRILLAAAEFRKLDQGRRCIPLSALGRLFFAMPQPLGSRTPDGCGEFGRTEKSVLLLIGAVLNLLEAQNGQRAA